MMHTTQDLHSALNSTLSDVEKLIETVTVATEKRIKILPYPDGVTVYEMTDADGRPVLEDLLIAKAQLLSSMANLKAADINSNGSSEGCDYCRDDEAHILMQLRSGLSICKACADYGLSYWTLAEYGTNEEEH